MDWSPYLYYLVPCDMQFKICAHSLLPILHALLSASLVPSLVHGTVILKCDTTPHCLCFVALSFFSIPSGVYYYQEHIKCGRMAWGCKTSIFRNMLSGAFFKGYHWAPNTWIGGSNSPPSPFSSVLTPFLHSPLKRLLAQCRLCESFLVIPPLKIVLLVLPPTVILLSVS